MCYPSAGSLLVFNYDTKALQGVDVGGCMAEVVNLAVTGMTCMGCAGSVKTALEDVEGVESAEVSIDPGKAVVTTGAGVSRSILISAVMASGFGIEGETSSDSGFNWADGVVWKQSAHNTKWCLIGCSIGDFGTIAAFQFVFTDSGWSPMSIMILAIINGLLTSIALETAILSKQMGLFEGFKVAIGMSFISMIAMESAMNITDYLMTGGAMLTWWVVPIMLIVGFITPWPYNYWRLKKFGKACH
uniref:Cation transport ATPase n=1 Tax=uncultured marine group II/III euryarchaeote KM3_87_G01 TaxID=1456533 RepID=A0A075HTS5_9EURY|nr:Cation transport ATPase [uncultured marine group II/III euryarchaeote KM3_87_G01]